MPERKPLSKKLRFEVFKRDSFACQYCGKKAPDVVLEVDHINPVAEGGSNDILNLITACFDCNRGKGKRKLDDNSVVEKQRAQIEELAQRKEQIEMILSWKKSLLSVEDYEIDAVNDFLSDMTGRNIELTDSGVALAKKALKEYGLDEFLESISIAYNQYSDSNIGVIVDKSFGIMKNRKMGRENIYHNDCRHLYNCCKNAWWGSPDFGLCYSTFMSLLESGLSKSMVMKKIYKTANFSEFEDVIYES